MTTPTDTADKAGAARPKIGLHPLDAAILGWIAGTTLLLAALVAWALVH